ncbi:MAG: glycosyl hydrolase-like protein [uncultured bacterium]|nr:MAG: glycosyl hydrolase-like protein [uncultured bacterium]
MLRKIKFFLLVPIIVLGSLTAFAVWKNNLPLISPIVMVEVLTGHAPALKSKRVVYGFFPYWNLKYADELNITSLTHFAYFAVDLNPDGTINKANSKKEQEPGWNKLNSKSLGKLLYQSKLLGQKSVLTVTAMDPETISSLLENPQNSQAAIESIMSVYREKDFDDLNVDFEYVGEPNETTRNGYTDFVKNLKSACILENPDCHIDIDIFADSAEKYRLWDLPALNKVVDRFVIMAYDYYRKSSVQAGPVAPLTGKCKPGFLPAGDCLDQDIITHLSQFTKIIPSEKILLGIPFYGYEWQTASKDYLAGTYPKTGALATYARIQTLFSDPEISSLSAKWSSTSLSPYLVYEKNDQIFQVQFENAQSLEQKIKLVKSANLGGIAIWALGYETPYDDLWLPIKNLSTP